jgi:hypothetical protein
VATIPLLSTGSGSESAFFFLFFICQDEGSSGDEFGGDAGEQEGDDSDFELPASKKKKPAAKSPAAAKKKSPAKSTKVTIKKIKVTKQKATTKKAAPPPSRGSQRAAAAKSIKYSGKYLSLYRWRLVFCLLVLIARTNDC